MVPMRANTPPEIPATAVHQPDMAHPLDSFAPAGTPSPHTNPLVTRLPLDLARVSWIARRELLSPQLRAGVCVKLV